MAVRVRHLTGVAELDAVLQDLAIPGCNRVAKSSLRAGLVPLKKTMKQLAPGSTKEEIGARLKTYGKGNKLSAKAGVNVANAGKDNKAVTTSGAKPISVGVLVAIGSKKRRFRKRLGGRFRHIRVTRLMQLQTGDMPANPFVSQAASASTGAVQSAMVKAGRKAIEREAAKAAKKK